MAKKTELIARGLLRRDGHVLLCRSIKHGYLYLPGGHIEVGEGAAKALAREFMEETGLMVRVGGLVAVSEGTFEYKGSQVHEVNLVFHVELGDVSTGVPVVESKESKIDFVWLPGSVIETSDIRPASAKRLLRADVELARCRFDSDMEN